MLFVMNLLADTILPRKLILVIDDDRIYQNSYDGKLVIHAKSSEAAIDFIEKQWPNISELWLDHDLGGDDTIRPVLNFIDEKLFHNEFTPDNHIIRCQSSNPEGKRLVREWAKHKNFHMVSNTPTPKRYRSHG